MSKKDVERARVQKFLKLQNKVLEEVTLTKEEIEELLDAHTEFMDAEQEGLLENF
jgi:hypothetical protein